MNPLSELVYALIQLPDAGQELSIESSREVITTINDYLYTTQDGLGEVFALGSYRPFLSEHHKYWYEAHGDILDLKINNEVCGSLAECLHEVFVRTNGRAFTEIYDTAGLSNEDFCRIRMLTANQDFNGTSLKIDKLAALFKKAPDTFNEHNIVANPDAFVSTLGLSSRSQNDKRSKYAREIAQFVIDCGVSPYEIFDYFERDVLELRKALIARNSAGYGNKKTDMFIRDMIVGGVWDKAVNFECIDVASDVNTMKVALRTGMLESAIPLVSSFLDIYCYQYSAVDNMTAKCWRRVWEIWEDKYPYEAPASPCMLDYFIFNVVGRQFCKELLGIYVCENGHTFKDKPRKRKCLECDAKAIRIEACLPCVDKEGYKVIRNTRFYKDKIAEPNYEMCPFAEMCTKHNGQKLMPPKSISILGQTGWETAYTEKGSGGGGLTA